jgi:anti-sigma regulatory factor (Ser/Thr protein kinase)
MVEHAGSGARRHRRAANDDPHGDGWEPRVRDLVRYWFAPSAAAPAEARARAGEALVGSPHLDTVTILVSELVTNAVLHTEHSSELRISELVAVTPGGGWSTVVRVEVRDGDRVVPSSPPVPGAHGGYGLRIVESMADAWGCTVLDDGKIMWFEVASRGSRSDQE